MTTNKQKFEKLEFDARITLDSTAPYTPYDAVGSGWRNALQTVKDGDVERGSEEFFSIALASIQDGCLAEMESGEHYDELKSWFKAHGLQF